MISRGLSWTAGIGITQQAAQFATIAVLARFLDPEAFGYYAAVLVVVAVGQAVTTSIAAPYIVYVKRLTRAHLAAATLVSLSVALLFVAALGFLSSSLAHLFALEGIAPMFVAASLAVLAISLSSVGSHYAYRRKAFRESSLVDLFAYLLGFSLVGAVGAKLGLGNWSLVLALICQHLIAAILYILCFPVLAFRVVPINVVRELINYGAWILWARLMAIIATQGDKLAASHAVGAAGLGLYSRGYQLSAMPADFYGKFGDKVIFSAFARAAYQRHDLERRQIIGFCISLIFGGFFSFTLIAVPEAFIRILFGEGWLEMSSVVAILAFAMPFRVGYKFLGTLLRANGHVRLSATHLSLYALAIPAAVSFGAGGGVKGISSAVAIVVTLHCIFLLLSTASALSWRARRVVPAITVALLPYVVGGLMVRSHYRLPLELSMFDALAASGVATIGALLLSLISFSLMRKMI